MAWSALARALFVLAVVYAAYLTQPFSAAVEVNLAVRARCSAS
jgi:hypothetical protein